MAQLNHRRNTLPEHAELARLSADRTATAADLVAADTAVADLEVEQSKAESDLEPVTARLARDERRIADGSVSDSRALSSLIEEVDHLRRRIATLEDAELAVMEQLETATAERDRLRQRVADLDAQAAAVEARRDEQLATLSAQIAEQASARQAIVPDVPADLMALYTKIAAARGGVGAAELVRRRCTGCQLEMNAADLRRFATASENEVLRCEECGRILIRTDQSGV